MNASKRYSPEVRERAVRMVQEQRKEHSSQWATIQSISSKIGCTSEALHVGFSKQSVTGAFVLA
jgi:transposase